MNRSARSPAGAIGCALLILSPAPGLHAQERLGRLFSSPEQRLELDRLRDAPGFGRTPEPAAVSAAPLPVSGPESGPESRPESRPGSRQGTPTLAVRFDGVILRGGVRRVSWINGVMTGAGTAAPGGIRIDDAASGGRIRLRLPGGRSTVALKPGQTIDGARSRVLEAYETKPPARSLQAAVSEPDTAPGLPPGVRPDAGIEADPSSAARR